MAQTKILIDTNSYYRLAQNLHPLMCSPFGDQDYTIYAHKDLNAELRHVSHLKSKCKLRWVYETRYLDNRRRSVTIPANKQDDIDRNYKYMWQTSLSDFYDIDGKGPSDVDTLILATALALDIYVITDDQDMIKLAKEYEVKQMTSMGLLKLMLDEGRIDYEKVTMVVEQWQYDNDIPHKNWKKEYKTLFKKEPPICSF